MFGKPSLMTRIVVAKSVGFVIGLVGFVLLSMLVPEVGILPQWGVLFWYTSIGAFIGIAGVLDRHPVLNLPLPWMVRGPVIGAWMNLVVVLMAYDMLHTVLVSIFGAGGAMSSPFWFVLEGALAGLLIDAAATRFGGEGRETLARSLA